MIDRVDFLLVLLTPFDASIATETAKVNSIDERRVQQINMMCWADFLHVVNQLVVDHVTVIHLDFELFDRLEHN